MINDFDRPEESALLLGGTVNFDTFGAEGFAVNAKAIFGDGTTSFGWFDIMVSTSRTSAMGS